MASAALPPTCKVILAQGIAKGLLEEVKQGLTTLNKKPKVVGLLANEDPAAKMYADWSMKTCVEKYVLIFHGFLHLSAVHTILSHTQFVTWMLPSGISRWAGLYTQILF
jgi:hypothetical protein